MILIYRVDTVINQSTLIGTADSRDLEKVREWCKLKTATANDAGLPTRYVYDRDAEVAAFSACRLTIEIHKLRQQLTR